MEFVAALPARTRAATRRRPPAVLALVALLLGAAAMLALAIARPMSPEAPVGLGWIMLVVALAMAAATFAAGDRMPGPPLVAQAAVAVVLNTVLVAEAHTTAGALGDGIAYIWLSVYVAAFFPRLAAAFATFAVAAYAAGLAVGGLPGVLNGWAILGLSTFLLAVLVGRGSASLRRRMATDPLTGVLNRDGLRAAAERAFARARRRSDEIAVAVLDLDGFKEINDRGGHASGDRLLAEASAAWRGVLRADDVLARTGGDEFVLVLPHTRAGEAAHVLDRLRDAHPIAWSAGVVQWRPGEALDACVERADARLYAAKAAGGQGRLRP